MEACSFSRWWTYACASLTAPIVMATSSSDIPYIRANLEKWTMLASRSASDMRCSGSRSAGLTGRREPRLLARARCMRHPLITERHQPASAIVGPPAGRPGTQGYGSVCRTCGADCKSQTILRSAQDVLRLPPITILSLSFAKPMAGPWLASRLPDLVGRTLRSRQGSDVLHDRPAILLSRPHVTAVLTVVVVHGGVLTRLVQQSRRGLVACRTGGAGHKAQSLPQP